MPRRKNAKRRTTAAEVQQAIEPKKKRKIRILSLQDRLSVIHHYERVTNTRKLAKIYDVCRGQIKSILRKKEKYFAEWQDKINANSNLKYIVRSAILGALVHEWLQRARSRGRHVTDVEIRRTAKHVAYLINFKEYQPSPAWLNRFKNKYKLRNLDPPKEVLGPKKSMNISKIFFELKSERVEDMLDKRFKYPSKAMFEEIETIGSEMQQIEKCKNMEGFGISSTESGTEDEELAIDIGGEQELDEKVSDEEDTLEPIKSYREALDQLELLGNFALSKEDFRVVGLINQLERLFLDEYFCE